MRQALETFEGGDALAALHGYIAEGGYRVGDRLPPERQLITDLGLTRARLRKALDALERDGAIWRHVGKGTFVAGDGGGGAGPITSAVAQLGRQLTPVRMMRARLCIEPALAREAAINASAEASTRMQLTMARAHAANNWRDYETQDDRFHRSVAVASDNLLLLDLFDQLNKVRRAVAGGSVERQSTHPAPDHRSFAEHGEIADAVAARDPDKAHEAMRKHLRSVQSRLFGD